MKARVLTAPAQDEYFFEEGCYILELSNSPDDPEASIARVRVEAGVTTRLHRLQGVAERYVILQGRGEVECGVALRRVVSAGDVVLIPPRCAQRIRNPGKEELIFLAICTPRFTRDCYEDIDKPSG